MNGTQLMESVRDKMRYEIPIVTHRVWERERKYRTIETGERERQSRI